MSDDDEAWAHVKRIAAEARERGFSDYVEAMQAIEREYPELFARAKAEAEKAKRRATAN